MSNDAAMNTFIIEQQKEWGEILTQLESRNKYIVKDTEGTDVYFAEELGGSLLSRTFLRAMRPFTMEIRSIDREILLTLERPFRFIFSELHIQNAQGIHIGSIKLKFAFLKWFYIVYDADGGVIMSIVCSIFHPWTFTIDKDGVEIGKILKKWSGIGKEMFTDADTFSLTFPEDLDGSYKSILLGAVFLIDFIHFENNQKR